MTPNSLAPSVHYTKERGEAYVASRQSAPHCFGYKLNFEYFRPYLQATDSVLDFGCGNGGMLTLLRQQVAIAEGVEVNPVAAAVARRDGSVIYEHLEQIPYNRQYDAIVSNHVLEHVRDVASTLEQLRQHLRPGGLFITKLPIDDWRERRQQSWSSGDIDHHLHTWTPRLLANVLQESGYQIQEVRVVTSAWHPKLFPCVKLGLGPLAFWALAVLKRRRQLVAVAVRPQPTLSVPR